MRAAGAGGHRPTGRPRTIVHGPPHHNASLRARTGMACTTGSVGSVPRTSRSLCRPRRRRHRQRRRRRHRRRRRRHLRQPRRPNPNRPGKGNGQRASVPVQVRPTHPRGTHRPGLRTHHPRKLQKRLHARMTQSALAGRRHSSNVVDPVRRIPSGPTYEAGISRREPPQPSKSPPWTTQATPRRRGSGYRSTCHIWDI